MTDQDLERLAQGYRAFVSEAAVESPVYSALAAAVAGDRGVLRFLAALPPGRRQPTLLFAALRSLGGVPADGAALHDRVLSDSERLAATMRARATQTNEPARCAGLLPALATIDGPLALVELGPPRASAFTPTASATSTTAVPSAPDGTSTSCARRAGPFRCPAVCRTSCPASGST